MTHGITRPKNMSSAPQGDQIAGRKYYEIHQNFAQNLVAGYALNPLGFLQLLVI